MLSCHEIIFYGQSQFLVGGVVSVIKNAQTFTVYFNMDCVSHEFAVMQHNILNAVGSVLNVKVN